MAVSREKLDLSEIGGRSGVVSSVHLPRVGGSHMAGAIIPFVNSGGGERLEIPSRTQRSSVRFPADVPNPQPRTKPPWSSRRPERGVQLSRHPGILAGPLIRPRPPGIGLHRLGHDLLSKREEQRIGVVGAMAGPTRSTETSLLIVRCFERQVLDVAYCRGKAAGNFRSRAREVAEHPRQPQPGRASANRTPGMMNSRRGRAHCDEPLWLALSRYLRGFRCNSSQPLVLPIATGID